MKIFYSILTVIELVILTQFGYYLFKKPTPGEHHNKKNIYTRLACVGSLLLINLIELPMELAFENSISVAFTVVLIAIWAVNIFFYISEIREIKKREALLKELHDIQAELDGIGETLDSAISQSGKIIDSFSEDISDETNDSTSESTDENSPSN